MFTWTGRTTPIDGDYASGISFNAFAWSPSLGLFVGLGRDDATTTTVIVGGNHWTVRHGIYTSPDGSVWTYRDARFGNPQGIIWDSAHSLFVAGGQNAPTTGTTFACLFTSPDGITWTDAGFTNLTAVAGLGYDSVHSRIMAGLFGSWGIKVYYSDDGGGTWTAATTQPGFGDFTGLAYSPTLDLWVVAGSGGLGLGANYVVATSADRGVNWTDVSSPWGSGGGSSGSGSYVMWSPMLNLFILGGTDTNGNESLMTSPDGVTWTVRTVPYDVPASYNISGDFVEVPGVGILGGYADFSGAIDHTLIFSADGINWAAESNVIGVAADSFGGGGALAPALNLIVSGGSPGGGAAGFVIETAPVFAPGSIPFFHAHFSGV